MASIPDTQDHRAAGVVALPSAANDYWRPTTRRRPCPACHRHGYCEVSRDGRWLHCMRAAHGILWSKRQGGHLLRVAGDGSADQSDADATRDDAAEPPAPCADADTLDAAYRMLHDLWPLSDADLALLTGPGHGLSESQARGLCASVPYDTLALRRGLNAVLDRFGITTTLAVPGFYLADTGHVAFAGRDLLLFRRDARGRVTGAQVRLRHPREGQSKYRYLTSTRYGGPTPGSAPHVAFPRGVARHGELWITEGLKKATIAADALGVPVVGLLGVGTWRRALDVAREVAATAVVVALDQDAKPDTAARVDRCRRALAAALARAGYGVKVATWPVEMAKGIDDLLLAGHMPVVVARNAGPVRLPALTRPAGVTLAELHRPEGVHLPALSRPVGVCIPEVRL